MKKSGKIFWRSFIISSVIMFNILLLFFGICKVYENTTQIASGEYVKAISLETGGIRILDYHIKIK